MTTQQKKMYCRLFYLLVVAILMIGSCGVAPAQDAPPATPAPAQAPTAPAPLPQPGSVIRAESKLVILDAIVTDKKGNYVHDLTQKDFKVLEDDKEQQVSSFSTGADTAIQAQAQKHYLILFFDNSSMAAPDQIQARGAAAKFIDANAGPGHEMAIVEFGGTLRIAQNFTANADVLQAAVKGAKTSFVASNTTDTNSGGNLGGPDLSPVTGAEAGFGARSMLLSLRGLARNLRSVPGRKMLVLFSAGFPLDPTTRSELTATIDACNKANVAVYSLDVRGLVANVPGGSARNSLPDAPSTKAHAKTAAARDVSAYRASTRPRLVRTSYTLAPAPDPQKPGGGGTGGGAGGAGGSGGRPSGGGGTGGTGGAGGTGGKTGGTGSTGTGGKTGGTPTTGNPGATRGGTTPTNYNPYNNGVNNPFNQPRSIIPVLPPSVTTNQEVLASLADGTGGFTIFNTNDLLGGLERIGKEGNEFYLLGYVPKDSPEGTCHTLKVKMNRGGLSVRSRSGYCNARSENPLEGKPVEKQLEARAAATGPAGSIHGNVQAPYFYTGTNVARVNLAMEIPADSLKFDKQKGKFHSTVNVLGIAYKPDGSVGAKFSDVVDLDFEKDDLKTFTKEPYHYQNQFDAAPGTYKLTVVLSGGGDTFGKFETPLTIEPYDGKSFMLGGVLLTNSAARVSDMSSGLDSVLLEDRTPLIVKGMQVAPSATNRFKKSDTVVMYTEIYEPLLASDKPPKVVFAYRVLDRATNKELIFTGGIPAEEFIQKGNPVIPAGLRVEVKNLPVGGYKMIVQAVDSANNHAPNRSVDFDVTD